jgi:hypothetical protein
VFLLKILIILGIAFCQLLLRPNDPLPGSSFNKEMWGRFNKTFFANARPFEPSLTFPGKAAVNLSSYDSPKELYQKWKDEYN